VREKTGPGGEILGGLPMSDKRGKASFVTMDLQGGTCKNMEPEELIEKEFSVEPARKTLDEVLAERGQEWGIEAKELDDSMIVEKAPRAIKEVLQEAKRASASPLSGAGEFLKQYKKTSPKDKRIIISAVDRMKETLGDKFSQFNNPLSSFGLSPEKEKRVGSISDVISRKLRQRYKELDDSMIVEKGGFTISRGYTKAAKKMKKLHDDVASYHGLGEALDQERIPTEIVKAEREARDLLFSKQNSPRKAKRDSERDISYFDPTQWRKKRLSSSQIIQKAAGPAVKDMALMLSQRVKNMGKTGLLPLQKRKDLLNTSKSLDILEDRLKRPIKDKVLKEELTRAAELARYLRSGLKWSSD
jgi:hypothetical protein